MKTSEQTRDAVLTYMQTHVGPIAAQTIQAALRNCCYEGRVRSALRDLADHHLIRLTQTRKWELVTENINYLP